MFSFLLLFLLFIFVGYLLFNFVKLDDKDKKDVYEKVIIPQQENTEQAPENEDTKKSNFFELDNLKNNFLFGLTPKTHLLKRPFHLKQEEPIGVKGKFGDKINITEKKNKKVEGVQQKPVTEIRKEKEPQEIKINPSKLEITPDDVKKGTDKTKEIQNEDILKKQSLKDKKQTSLKKKLSKLQRETVPKPEDDLNIVSDTNTGVKPKLARNKKAPVILKSEQKKVFRDENPTKKSDNNLPGDNLDSKNEQEEKPTQIKKTTGDQQTNELSVEPSPLEDILGDKVDKIYEKKLNSKKTKSHKKKNKKETNSNDSKLHEKNHLNLHEKNNLNLHEKNHSKLHEKKKSTLKHHKMKKDMNLDDLLDSTNSVILK